MRDRARFGRVARNFKVGFRVAGTGESGPGGVSQRYAHRMVGGPMPRRAEALLARWGAQGRRRALPALGKVGRARASVLAADAAHYYENMEAPNPFPLVYNVGDMIDGYRTMALLADSSNHIIPGHDPLVRERYPAPFPEAEGIVMRLDVDPSG